MKHISLGGLDVARIGLGAMTMSACYTGAGSDDDEAIRTIHRALDLGVTMIDTAEIYGPFTNEELIGRALKGRRDEAVIATKFGNYSHGGGGPWQLDSSPANIRLALEGSLTRLGVERIDLYYQHRVDPKTPIEDTVGTLAELVREGKIAHIGLCEAGAATIRRAAAVAPIAAVQSEYSLWTRGVEAEILPTLRELGIGFVAYSPLGSEENFQKNLALVDEVEDMAAEAGATAAQVALAWLLAQGAAAIPGTKRVARVEENSAADAVELASAQLERLTALQPAAGDRHDEAGLAGTNI